MACNCSKNRTAQPTGFARAGRSQQEAQRDGASRVTKVEYTAPDGSKSVGSRLEASAAVARRGGSIRPV